MLYAIEYYGEDGEAFEELIEETSQEKAVSQIYETHGDVTIFSVDRLVS